MAMFMAQEDFCGWCGKEGAAFKCACGRIRFCGRSCQKAAWPEHRLVCSSVRPSSSKNLYPGDVVRIHGLQSSTGRQINECLAEVQELLDTGRVKVIVTAPDFRIKTLAVRPENLAMHLTAREAASRASDLEKEPCTGDPDTLREWMASCVSIAQTIPTLSGAEIVQRIGEGDRQLLQALMLPPSFSSRPLPQLTTTQQEAMYDNGLVTTILGKLRFPESIDVVINQQCPTEYVTEYYLNILSNTLCPGNFGPTKETKLNAARVDVCRKLGPALLACTTKKRRLHGRPEHWWGVQFAITALLGNCMIAEGVAAAVLLKEVDPSVTSAMLEHIIFALTVDPTRYLPPDTPLAGPFASGDLLDHSRLKKVAMPVLVELVDISRVGENVVYRIGTSTVPAGAPGLSGRMFAECFLDVAARVALAVIGAKESDGHHLAEELHYVYSCLLRSPRLVPLLGEFDHAFISANSSQALLRWARKQCGSQISFSLGKTHSS